MFQAIKPKFCDRKEKYLRLIKRTFRTHLRARRSRLPLDRDSIYAATSPTRSIQTNPRIITAGIEAKAHLTMKITIDSNGIFISVTTTFLEPDLLSRATKVAKASGVAVACPSLF